MIIELATKQDIDNWMDLVGKVKDNFPGLETEEALDEHRNTVLDLCTRVPQSVQKQTTKL